MNNPSGIIINDDYVPSNKMALKNYYLNYNTINNINKSTDSKRDTKNVSNKIKKSWNKNNENLLRKKVRYPRPDGDNYLYMKKYNIFNSSLSKTNVINNKL